MPYKNKQDQLDWEHQRYLNQKNEITARSRAWCKNNRQRINQHRRELRKNNPELYRERDREYYALHKEHIRAYNNHFNKENRPKIRQRRLCIEHRRIARKNSLPATLTNQQWNAIKLAYNFRCAYCGKKVKLLTQDHVIPIYLGGGYTADNIVPACRNCNSSKGIKLRPAQLALA